MATRLTNKQKKFVNEYLIDLNATQAATRAGYKNANIGRRLVTKSNVTAYIQRRQASQEQRTEVTQDKVLRELANIAFANGTDYAKAITKGDFSMVKIVPTDSLTKPQKAAITCIKQTQTGIEVKLADKMKALELLGKHLGMFGDKPPVAEEPEDDNLYNAIDEAVKKREV